MKRFLILLIIGLTASFTFAQSDDDLFGGSDDDLFADESIVEVNDVSAKTDLSKCVIFDTGAIKVGGSLTAGITTNTVLYSPENKTLGENIYNSTLKPDLSAFLSVDARPTETLRIYTKFGFAYPFEDKVVSNGSSFTIADWFKLKELFTDFSMKDTAFFRFGIHTVTWGTGYFFSPVSDMINTSSIDPENPEKQVDGALNLRTQIVFPHSQNCIWLYVIPSTNFQNQTAESYMRETAVAGKVDLVLGGWEFGLGGYYKYQNAPKAMLTASGSLKKINLFGEFVYSYGSTQEWGINPEWDNKTNIIQATAGFSYYWKDPMINFAAQYYYNGNIKDVPYKYIISGHNIAANLSFGKLFNNKDFTANIFAMANFGRVEMTSGEIAQYRSYGVTDDQLKLMTGTSLTATAMLYYSPIKELKFGLGPSVTFKDFNNNRTISLKLSGTFGGGKF